jgi:hypothetical protein
MFRHYTKQEIVTLHDHTRLDLGNGQKPKHCLSFAYKDEWYLHATKRKYDRFYAIKSFGETNILWLFTVEQCWKFFDSFCVKKGINWNSVSVSYDGVFIPYFSHMYNPIFDKHVGQLHIWNPTKLTIQLGIPQQQQQQPTSNLKETTDSYIFI